MSHGDSNPAAVPHAAEDTQGDDRWMSQVRELLWEMGGSFLRGWGLLGESCACLSDHVLDLRL